MFKIGGLMTQDTFLSPIWLSKSIQIPSLKLQDRAFLSVLVPWPGQNVQPCTQLFGPPTPTTLKAATNVDCAIRQ